MGVLMFRVHFFFFFSMIGVPGNIICSALRGHNIFKLQVQHNPCRMERGGPGFCVSENENEEPPSPIDSCGSGGERAPGPVGSIGWNTGGIVSSVGAKDISTNMT